MALTTHAQDRAAVLAPLLHEAAERFVAAAAALEPLAVELAALEGQHRAALYAAASPPLPGPSPRELAAEVALAALQALGPHVAFVTSDAGQRAAEALLHPLDDSTAEVATAAEDAAAPAEGTQGPQATVPQPVYRLCAVQAQEYVAGEWQDVTAYAVVRPIAEVADGATRVFVDVIDGAGDLEAGQIVTVRRDRLLSLEEAERLREARSQRRDLTP